MFIISVILTGGNKVEKNSDNFSMNQAIQFANSPAGKKLLAALQKADPSALQSAARAASSGDVNAAKAALLSSEEVAKILGQLGG